MGSNLTERFSNVVEMVKAGATTVTTGASTTEKYITGLSVDVPAGPPQGLGYNIKVAGTRTTGTNGNLVIKVYLGSTAVLTLTSDANASTDWSMEATILFVNPKVQRVYGIFHQITQDPNLVYGATAANCSAAVALTVSMTQGHGSDTSTANMWTVQRFVVDTLS
jgi:hypothetical protein